MTVRKPNQPSARLQEAGELWLVHPEAGRAGVEQRRLEPICIGRAVAESPDDGSRKVDAAVVDLEVEEARTAAPQGLPGNSSARETPASSGVAAACSVRRCATAARWASSHSGW